MGTDHYLQPLGSLPGCPLFVPVGVAAEAASALAAAPNGAGPTKQQQEQPVDHKGKGKYVEPAKPQDADEDDEEVDFDAEVGKHRCSHRRSSTKLCGGKPASQPVHKQPLCWATHALSAPRHPTKSAIRQGLAAFIIRTSCWRGPGLQASLRAAAGVRCEPHMPYLLPGRWQTESKAQADCDATPTPIAGTA